MQTIKHDNTTIIIDGETVTVNGRVARFEPEPVKEVHPFLKDVPEVGERCYRLDAFGIAEPVWPIEQTHRDRGTVSRNREALVELDRRRVALTALKRWIGENNIPVATEEQLANKGVSKYSFAYSCVTKMVCGERWALFRPVGDIHFLSQATRDQVRDNCDSLIRTAYGWPEVTI